MFYSVAYEFGRLPSPINQSETYTAAKLQDKDSISFYNTRTSLEFPTYTADTWPQHWEDKRNYSAATYYEHMSEEFNTWSKLQMLGPEQADTWCPAIKSSGAVFIST
jgi:hypothetical protein